MSDQQLSFLNSEPSAFDVNAVDDGVIGPGTFREGSVATFLSRRPVDDWVLGLGFTNWKTLIDHALQTGHYELFPCEAGGLGLRKCGFRYAPIPRLPDGGSTYILQRLLVIASARNDLCGRQEKLISAAPDFAHKCVIEKGFCDLTVKQAGEVIRVAVPVEELHFDDHLGESVQLAAQLEQLLVKAGANKGQQLTSGCKSLTSRIVRIATGGR